jgi:uncharacterized membrane protein
MILDQVLISKKSKPNKNSQNAHKLETPIRSIAKSISWRIVGTIDTVVISWFITNKLTLALTIGSIELVTKMILYFFHERVWNIINWGKK